MNQAYDNDSYESDSSDGNRFGKVKAPTTRRRPVHARAGARPASHNGIHRRRNKRFSW